MGRLGCSRPSEGIIYGAIRESYPQTAVLFTSNDDKDPAVRHPCRRPRLLAEGVVAAIMKSIEIVASGAPSWTADDATAPRVDSGWSGLHNRMGWKIAQEPTATPHHCGRKATKRLHRAECHPRVLLRAARAVYKRLNISRRSEAVRPAQGKGMR